MPFDPAIRAILKDRGISDHDLEIAFAEPLSEELLHDPEALELAVKAPPPPTFKGNRYGVGAL
ncbi:MAG: hypothetical protein Q7T11_03040 [Deltaproteobacteria bacterium]|nr:hypothetical protein [Deltaproteobacteria bacterium]